MTSSPNTFKAVIIPVKGDTVEVEWEHPVYPKLREALGGWLEAVSPHEKVTLFMDEEGKLKGLPVNPIATWLWWFLQPETRGVDTINGTVVVTGGTDEDGETLPVDPMMAELIAKVVEVDRNRPAGE